MPITIELDRGSGPYKGGDLIIGKVVVINDSDKVRQLNSDLTITFLGKAWTQWKEGRNTRDNIRQYLVSKWEIETYFNQSFLLLQPGNFSATRSIEPGVTELPFIYQLPANLPSTFTSKHGGVAYSAQVLYKRPWKWDKLVQTDLHIQGSYNLNWFSMSDQPGYFTLVKKVWCGFGKIKANLFIAKRGFVPGDEISFRLELENETRLKLKKIRVYLLQITTYNAQSSTRQDMKKCCKLKCPSVASKQQLNYPGSFIVPTDLPITDLGGCRIVQPKYSLLLKIKTGFFGKTSFYSVLEGRVPITIGTTESLYRSRSSACHLRSVSINNYSPSSVFSNFESVAIAGSSLWNVCSSYNRETFDSDPPPAYEDALAFPTVQKRCHNKYAIPAS